MTTADSMGVPLYLLEVSSPNGLNRGASHWTKNPVPWVTATTAFQSAVAFAYEYGRGQRLTYTVVRAGHGLRDRL